MNTATKWLVTLWAALAGILMIVHHDILVIHLLGYLYFGAYAFFDDSDSKIQKSFTVVDHIIDLLIFDAITIVFLIVYSQYAWLILYLLGMTKDAIALHKKVQGYEKRSDLSNVRKDLESE